MFSGQGTGKGTLILFMEYVLRSVNIVSIAGLHSIAGRFNTLIIGKRLVNINEMSSTKEEFRSNFDTMKSYITEPTIKIEPKGVDAYTIKNISNFVLFTNHRDAIIVEETDRRYAIFEVSEAHMNDNEYFGRIRRECLNQDVANEFYTYLLDFPVVPLNQIPDTELRREMMQISKPNTLKFLDAVRENNLYDGAEEVSATSFYDRYKQWCSDNGERGLVTSTKFGTIVNTKLQKRRTNRGWVYVMSGLSL
jgi:phage/plasmid-associated DNA primase